MKLTCSVVEDLLPSYYEGACSKVSRELVEEHLKECEACQRVLDVMEGEELLPPEEEKEERELRSLAHWWKKKNHLNAIVYTMFLVVILGVGYYFATWYVDVTIAADKIEISHVYQMPDGRITFNLFVEGGYDFQHAEKGENGELYIIPKRSFPGTPDRGNPLWWNHYMDFYPAGIEREPSSPMSYFEPDEEITAVYVGPVGKGILVWQEGDEVPKATQEWEELIARYYAGDSQKYYETVSKD
ncbi:MAG: zf-HC2 domain-containing protein [Ruminiclostridium sp.]|nr:zf-HC2 domain-containing protein [Ruminiclostridium sp.]